MQKKFHVKKGDNVIVIAGDYKNQKGKVLAVYRDKNRVLVEGVNIITQHKKQPENSNQDGRLKKEAPIHISNVMLLDPATGVPTRIGRRKGSNDKLVRYAVKSKEEIK